MLPRLGGASPQPPSTATPGPTWKRRRPRAPPGSGPGGASGGPKSPVC